MKMDNVELMKQAREKLKDKWGFVIGVYFLYFLITLVVNGVPKVGGLASFLIGGAMAIGLATFSLSFSRGHKATVSQLFVGFNQFGRALHAYFLVVLFTVLWLLLLIVPGIIAALSYSQTFFIMAEDESIGARKAIKKSKAMMDGHKEKLFYLNLRFLGWCLLGILTLGIGFLWLIPYIQVTKAKFYDEISGRHTSKHTT